MTAAPHLVPWNDGHVHMYSYFGGMASCSLCAATVSPDGKISKPTQRSREHRKICMQQRAKRD